MGILTPAALALAIAFAPLTLSNAQTTQHTNHVIHHRRQSIPNDLPGNWTSLGCYTDSGVLGSTLKDATTSSSDSMTIESCINFCDSQGYVYAGTQSGANCACDNWIWNGGSTVAESECNTPCTGDSLEPCGASGLVNVFFVGQGTPPAPPIIVPGIGDWVSLGCWTDTVDGAPRTLSHLADTDGPVTIESCTTACFESGWRFAGTESSQECFCDSAIDATATQTPDADCGMLCAGDSAEICGGLNRLTIYNYTGTDLPVRIDNNGGNNR